MGDLIPYGEPLVPPPARKGIKCPSWILMGPPGTGKTWSIVTLLLCGIEVFMIITEPNGLDSILDAIRMNPDRTPRPPALVKELMSRFHYKVILPPRSPWSDMKDMARLIATSDFETLKNSGSKRSPTIYIALLEVCNNFVCDRTGESFGDVGEWDDTRALIIDSLSGINSIFMNLVMGFKPSPAKPEWGIMINQCQHFLYTLQTACWCYLGLNAHVFRGNDELTGAGVTTPAGLTKNYSGLIGKDFSEVILAVREGKKFTWTTMALNTDVKNRALPIAEGLPADFSQLVTVHRARVEAAKAEQSAA